MKNKNKQTKKRQKRNQKEYCSCDQLYTCLLVHSYQATNTVSQLLNYNINSSNNNHLVKSIWTQTC